MILDVLRNLFAGNLCVGDAGNLLPGADQGWASLRYDLFKCLDQRVGFAGTGTGFEAEVESVLQACLNTLLRCSRRGRRASSPTRTRRTVAAWCASVPVSVTVSPAAAPDASASTKCRLMPQPRKRSRSLANRPC